MVTIQTERISRYDQDVLIVKYPTGVKYTAQCGGMLCSHPECEGFAICIGNAFEKFDDCDYGCQYLSFNDAYGEELRNVLAADLDVFLQETTSRWMFKIRFDFDRIDELQEGWWPVVVNGELDGQKIQTSWVGFIHTGNCD